MSAKKRVVGTAKGQYRVVRKGKKPATRYIIWFRSAAPYDVPASVVGWRSLDRFTNGVYASRARAERAILAALKAYPSQEPANFEVRELVS